MRIAIAGMGVAGSTLARSLDNSVNEIECFDPKRMDFYPPCGWAVNEHEFNSLLSRIGIDGSVYLLSRASKIIFRNSKRSISFPSTGLCTIDKKRFLEDMAEGIAISRRRLVPEDYDLVFDCTGISRAYIGPAKNDFTMKAVEAVSNKNNGTNFEFTYYAGGRGYGWIFPLGKNSHIGSGSDEDDLNSYILSEPDRIRITGRNIRLRPLFDQSVLDNIVAVGESAGTVSPITGEGIVPSMKNAFLISQMLENTGLREFLDIYPSRLTDEFGDYVKLFELLEGARKGSMLRVSNIPKIRTVLRNFRSFGVGMSLWNMLRSIL